MGKHAKISCAHSMGAIDGLYLNLIASSRDNDFLINSKKERKKAELNGNKKK